MATPEVQTGRRQLAIRAEQASRSHVSCHTWQLSPNGHGGQKYLSTHGRPCAESLCPLVFLPLVSGPCSRVPPESIRANVLGREVLNSLPTGTNFLARRPTPLHELLDWRKIGTCNGKQIKLPGSLEAATRRSASFRSWSAV